VGVVEGLCPRCLLAQGLDPGAPSSIPSDPTGRRRPHPAPWDPSGFAPIGRFGAGPARSVLLTLADSIGPVPRILLREAAAAGQAPAAPPSAPEGPADDGARGRYEFLGEIARGGMGAVLRGRDTDLGRDLVVKVLLEEHRNHAGLIRRFIEEAQIGGQLQHPGVVPVYELGCFEDRRPFFTMKLVRGLTLAALLEARPDPARDRPRFLSIFEAICQTMAYAHARGVIHRDLKPANVMVGSFGEVQVMDWGLAKVLPAEPVTAEATPGPDREASVETVRSRSPAYASRAGSVMGTPAYMPPEQARGEVEAVDERTDVFALGAILCQILTGQPPYSGRADVEVHREDTGGELAEAFGRLAACGAEAELLELARRCLAPDPEDRPRDAGAVARAMTAYLAGVQERLLAAELARVEAQARTVAERKRRRTQLRMAAGILVALGAGIAGMAIQWNRAEANFRKARSRFDLARDAIERFYTGASEDVLLKEPQLKPLREKLLGSALEFYKRLQASLEAESGEAPGAELAAAYERVGEVTGEIGSPITALDSLQRARAIRQRLAEEQPGSAEAQEALARVLARQSGFLSEVGRAAEALEALQPARAIRQRLADAHPGVARHRIDLARTDGRLAHLLHINLNRVPEALQAVERAVAAYAGLVRRDPTDTAAARGLGEARLIQGGIWLEVARTAEALDALGAAVAIYDELVRRHPEDLASRQELGHALTDRATAEAFLNRLDDAERFFRSALATSEALVRDQPNVSRYQFDLGKAHHSLAWLYARTNRKPAALEEYRKALQVLDRLAHDHPSVPVYVAMQGMALSNLGDALRALGRLDEALDTMRRAQQVAERLARENPQVNHYQRSRAFSQIVTASLLNEMGRRGEATTAYERALESYESLASKNASVIYNMACAHACLASLLAGEPGPSPSRRALAARHLDQAMASLRQAAEAGYRDRRSIAEDHDLDPLRSRPDFRRLMMDLAFPDDPFGN
jgi:tetratricopeptide (TPR) repeat protein